MSPTIAAPRRSPAERARTPVRRAGASRPARRISGPIGGRQASASLPGARSRQAPREHVALGGRALALVRGLPDNSLIDRLVRGRAWIPVLGVLLAGLVAMQVEILKLGASMGRAMERGARLQTQNESLQASVAGLADDQRIERLAAGMGMVMPAPGALVFLSSHPGRDLEGAIGNIHPPDPTGFLAQLTAQAAALAALSPSPPITAQAGTTSSTLTPGTTSGTATVAATPPASSTATTTTATSTTTAQTPASTGPTTTAPSTTQAATTTPSAGSTAPASSSGAAAPTGAAGVAPAASSPSGTSGG